MISICSICTLLIYLRYTLMENFELFLILKCIQYIEFKPIHNSDTNIRLYYLVLAPHGPCRVGEQLHCLTCSGVTNMCDCAEKGQFVACTQAEVDNPYSVPVVHYYSSPLLIIIVSLSLL